MAEKLLAQIPERPVLAGACRGGSFEQWLLPRRFQPFPAALLTSNVKLFSNFKRIVHFDAKVSNSALKLGMSEQKLNSA